MESFLEQNRTNTRVSPEPFTPQEVQFRDHRMQASVHLPSGDCYLFHHPQTCSRLTCRLLVGQPLLSLSRQSVFPQFELRNQLMHHIPQAHDAPNPT